MPGNELVSKEELNEIKKIFTKSDGVLFAHGFEERRKNIFKIRTFENNLKKYFKSKNILCVSSGTAALKICLKACNVKPGDEVITQAFNFIATVEAIVDIGAIPIITNIDETLNMDPEDLKKKLLKKLKLLSLYTCWAFRAKLMRLKKFVNIKI